MRPTDPAEWLRASGVPTPSGGNKDDAAWDERAERIVQLARGAQSATDLDEVLGPVPLEPEPGEPRHSSFAAPVIVGATSMSDSNSDRPNASSPPMSQRSASGPQSMRSRPSLKELAERVSKTPPPASSIPSAASTPPPAPAPPSSLSAVAQASLKASPPTSSTATPLPAVKVPSSPPASVASPVSVAPGKTASDAPPPSAAAPVSAVAPASAAAPVIPITAAKEKKEEEKKGGGFGGIAIALIGVAAAAGIFFFLRTSDKPKPEEPTKQAQTQPAEEPTAEPAATQTAEPAPQAEAPKDDGAIDIDNLAEATASATATPGGPLPAQSGAVALNDPNGPANNKPEKVNADGTLDEAMRDAAGVEGGQKADATPAAEDENKPKNIPDRPPTGKVTAAVGAVMGGAKACVAGADDASRATITFGSDGSVKSVSVSGWAAGKPAASCIQSALKGANVGPFSQPTFVFGVSIRP